MPRRQFVADLKRARNDIKPAGILDIRAGDDDGQFEFEFAAPTLDGAALIPVTITAMIPDVSDYPKNHEYMVFCGDDAPRHIGQALQDVRSTQRKTVFELVDIVATTLSSLAPDSDGDTHMVDSQAEYDQYEDDEVEEYESDDEDDAFAYGALKPTPATAFVPMPSRSDLMRVKDRAFRQRVRSDLRAAKAAGFRVGHLGHLIDGYNAFVTVSIRISKLGISEEALQAWGLEPSEYLILIIQYPNGYKTNEELQSYDAIRLKPNIGMRVYAGKRYKPTVQEAIKAFTKAHRDQSHTYLRDKESQEEYRDTSSIRETFISRSTTALLEDTLVPVLRFRSTGMDWSGAESWFQYAQSESKNMLGNPNAVPDKYFTDEEVNPALPEIVRGDQYSHTGVYQHSFPLLAMQFLLRHFVRCTEFCLVCHSKMSTELEAIKPYVCDNPLCLFQYMALGFGPSIEHEIMAQPYVVDLLVSFCYSSAQSKKLKDFPDGLAMMVPPITQLESAPSYGNAQPYQYTIGRRVPQQQLEEPANVAAWRVGFDQERLELIFFDKPNDGCPVARGTWIVIKTAADLEEPSEELHCRVMETTFYPTLKVDKPVVVKRGPFSTVTEVSTMPKKEQIITPATTPRYTPATFTIYNKDFERLDSDGKCAAICKLLDTLPSVKDMQEYLSTRHPADLKSWTQRMSPAAISLLRWIIASNRACIMQVDGGDGTSSTPKKQERIQGMMGYMQFRFAMGAPDKEQRFLSEVRNTTTRLDLNYPTIFAWHGSPVYNWHMIIREGLHYKNTDHGRAYGHGVYHAKEAGTSSGYAGMRGGYGGGSHYGWRNSVLKVSSALALNEIVNATSEFVSHNPYYVVAQLDWIQTRYLFVECQPTDANLIPNEEREIEDAHDQDPARTPRGISQAIEIPASAIKSGRKVKTAAEKQTAHSSLLDRPSKKFKGKSGDPIVISDDGDSPQPVAYESDTDASDIEILFDEDEPEPTSVSLAVAKKPTGPTTDFVPNTLNFATLPMMPLPTYATSSTTKRLMNELRTLSRIQDSTPAAELGWHVPVDSIENVYQWIVELHSFHTFTPTLPLATDMSARNIKSIVLEIRFGSDFPFSPPYVRVIRPRLLPFQQGGGGHVVMGGAMCMELLTADGWSSVLGMEGVLLQVRMAIASEPHAKLEGRGRGGGGGDYGAGEAAEGYMRACRTHGWTVPRGFKEVAHGMGGPVEDGYGT